MNISEEQRRIVDSVGKDGVCTIVEAVAGAGKTTTSCHLSLTYPNKRVVIVTYNKHLEIEVKQKVRGLGCNADVYTYHGLAGAVFKRVCQTDQDILNCMNNGDARRHGIECDVLVVDEAQDMTLNYFAFIHMFLGTFDTPPCLLVMGDQLQSVYAFKGADERFLARADHLYEVMRSSESGVKHLSLRTSYRLTREIATFMNDVVLGAPDQILAIKSGPPVEYVICNPFVYVQNTLADIIVDAIESREVAPDDIFVLAFAMGRGMNPLKKLENELVHAGIPCYSPTSDQGRPDEDVIQGKVVFSTFHQSKGRERKWVIVFGVDEGYYTFYDKTASKQRCPPPLYVAMTRASHRLTLIHDSMQRPLPFFKRSLTEIQGSKSVQLMIYQPMRSFASAGASLPAMHVPSKAVTDLVKFIPDKHTPHINDLLQRLFTVERKGGPKVALPVKVGSKHKGQFEDVSDITAIAVTLMWVAECVSPDIIKKFTMTQHMSENMESMSIEEYLHLANRIQSENTCFISRVAQIKEYTWLTIPKKNKCIKNMSQGIEGKEVLFVERPLISCMDSKNVGIDVCHPRYGTFKLTGRIDVETPDTIWEVKCVDEITTEHRMQLVLYAYMWQQLVTEGSETEKQFKLINARDGEVQVLDYRSYWMQEVVEAIFQAKMEQNERLSDDEFVSMVRRHVQPI